MSGPTKKSDPDDIAALVDGIDDGVANMAQLNIAFLTTRFAIKKTLCKSRSIYRLVDPQFIAADTVNLVWALEVSEGIKFA